MRVSLFSYINVNCYNNVISGFDLPDEMIQRFAKRLLTERPINMSLIGIQK